MKDDRLYLIHIRECLDRINQYTAGGRAAFFADTMIQDAVLRNLHIMAESTQRLSSEIKNGHAEVDWRRVAAFRNVLVHDYLGIKLERIWEIAERDLSPDNPRTRMAPSPQLSLRRERETLLTPRPLTFILSPRGGEGRVRGKETG